MTQIRDTFELCQHGFTGGRLNKEGDGFCKVVFECFHGEDAPQYTILLEDNMTAIDGEYSPISLEQFQLIALRSWIDWQLAK